ncbi:hypothetical protein [Amycolatopsis saalfeldensis]|uniref:Uncharacterized protein n=1 Tax=Amycolatopsis saalfeldensis TaxID=394193 RepID=A0A1H8YJW0_9PSEU|nr:hypothetical protein [Amycolatopsis saalfeldensis]SEP52429.1 hypothetical protein SAMN04489732_12092 [Amycolatopsis saalfeldensis]
MNGEDGDEHWREFTEEYQDIRGLPTSPEDNSRIEPAPARAEHDDLVAIALRAVEALELTAEKMVALATVLGELMEAGGPDNAAAYAEYQRKALTIAAEIPRAVIRQCAQEIQRMLDERRLALDED